MRRHWRRIFLGIFSVIALFMCDCAGTSKKYADQRFTEDLQKNGFSIVMVSKGDVTYPDATFSESDVESIEKLMEWFRSRPVNSADINSGPMAMAQLEAFKHQDPVFPTVKIETDRFRVSFYYFPPSMVVLESRTSSKKAWEPVCWKARQEDEVLRHWAAAQFTENIKRVSFENAAHNDVAKEE